MSSNPQADTEIRRSRRAPGNWSLSTRLMVGQILLLVLVCIGIGAVTEVALRQYLVAQLDQSLTEISHRSTVLSSFPPPPIGPDGTGRPYRRPGPGPDFLDAPGQPVGLIAVVVHRGGRLEAGLLTSAGDRAALPDPAVETLTALEPGARPVAVDLDELGSYRAIAAQDRGGDVIVTAMPMSDVNATMLRVLLIFVVVAVATVLIASTVGAMITRRALTPLTRVAATAREVANLPLDRGEVELPVRVSEPDTNPNTEVGQMGSALNRMLDHIAAALSTRQASETRVRQFVADASHELRTPLTAIRGYSELVQRHRSELPDEVAHAMGRVSSEAKRLSSLVEDLLLLARLDSGRPLEQEPVDLSQLAIDAVSDAHVAGADHEWNLDLPEEPVTVTGDTARLHQVLTNLLANARVHTPPGTTVTVSLTPEPDAAVLRVADDGPGIPTELQSEVFERFARGDTSRSRTAGSTGLGLAIVAAVVRAHGGSIDVQSRPGDTEFVVRLPFTAGA